MSEGAHPDAVVTVPASLLKEVHDLAAAGHDLARAVESNTRGIDTLRGDVAALAAGLIAVGNRLDAHAAAEKPALDLVHAWTSSVLSEKTEAAAEALAADTRARAKVSAAKGAVADAVKKLVPWLLAAIMGGGWVYDRVTQTTEIPHAGQP